MTVDTAVALADPRHLTIAEQFGPTLQGEGPSAGRPCVFVRLGRCNLDCSWCDTPFTWDWAGKNGRPYNPAVELTRKPVTVIAAEVEAAGVPMVVITGGEPMVQRHGVTALVDALPDTMRVEIETNGTATPTAALMFDRRVWWNVSPKLANSGIDTARRFHPDVLNGLAATGRAAFKFVVDGPADLVDVDALIVQTKIDPADVWIMPQGTTPAAILDGLDELANAVIAAGYNMTTRLHVLAWGDRRGK